MKPPKAGYLGTTWKITGRSSADVADRPVQRRSRAPGAMGRFMEIDKVDRLEGLF